jgi:hypothetical protein
MVSSVGELAHVTMARAPRSGSLSCSSFDRNDATSSGNHGDVNNLQKSSEGISGRHCVGV